MKTVITAILFLTVTSAYGWGIWGDRPGTGFRICPGNLRYLAYGTTCSCDDDLQTTAFCPISIGYPRCRCPLGTIRVSAGIDKCVLPDKCPKKTCPGNLVYRQCGSRCTPTCRDPHVMCPKICDRPRCECPPGTVLSSKDKCISPEQCPVQTTTTVPPKRCSGDLVFSRCGSMCTFTCETRSMACAAGCAEPRCQCPGGTVLVGKDKCIDPEECPKVNVTTTPSVPEQPIVCSGDLVFRECGSMCTFTCDTQVMLCPLACAAPRCQCPGGTVLQGEDKCIKPEDCPNKESTTAVPLSPV